MPNYKDITIGDLEYYSPKKAADIIEHIVEQRQNEAVALASMAKDIWQYNHRNTDSK